MVVRLSRVDVHSGQVDIDLIDVVGDNEYSSLLMQDVLSKIDDFVKYVIPVASGVRRVALVDSYDGDSYDFSKFEEDIELATGEPVICVGEGHPILPNHLYQTLQHDCVGIQAEISDDARVSFNLDQEMHQRLDAAVLFNFRHDTVPTQLRNDIYEALEDDFSMKPRLIAGSHTTTALVQLPGYYYTGELTVYMQSICSNRGTWFFRAPIAYLSTDQLCDGLGIEDIVRNDRPSYSP